MGVPCLFKTLVKKFPSIITYESNNIDHLFFDFNCLIHHCTRYLNNINDLSTREIDEELITEIIRYCVYITTVIVRPKRLVYIAIDGPVPMAKVVRQRERRYKKVYDEVHISKIKKHFNEKSPKKFETNKITPGTSFMIKLSVRIRNYINIGAFNSHLNDGQKFKVICSDANCPGEGESKIMQFINGNMGNPNICIYGMDADLIILSMLTNKPIKLLRESQELDEEQSEFCFMDIELCKHSLTEEYKWKSYDQNCIIKDFCFLTKFGGNDFVEALICTKIRENGFNHLCNWYSEYLNNTNEHLIQNDAINFEFLKFLIEKAKKYADKFVKSKRYYKSQQQNQQTFDSTVTAYYHTYYNDPLNPSFEVFKNIIDKINFQAEYNTWSYIYKKHFDILDNKNVCEEYIKSLQFSMSYYVNGIPPSWNYHYKYRVAPLPNDLLNYLNSIESIPSFNEEPGAPLTPIEQLAIVSPPQSFSLLPKYIAETFSDDFFEDLFPKKFKLDVLKGMKNIYSDPILPPPDVYTIKKILRHIPVTEYEFNRNVLHENAYSKNFT